MPVHPQIAGVDFVYFIQRNSLNRRDRTLKIEAWNDSFASRVEIKEFCYYSVSSIAVLCFSVASFVSLPYGLVFVPLYLSQFEFSSGFHPNLSALFYCSSFIFITFPVCLYNPLHPFIFEKSRSFSLTRKLPSCFDFDYTLIASLIS